MHSILLVGIGGVYNYGCEAIIRGTEAIVHSAWPDAQIVYASFRPDDDRVRLKDCPVGIVKRSTPGRYSPKNIARKLLSIAGVAWHPLRDAPSLLRGHDAVFSVGGDIYTLGPTGDFGTTLPRLGDLAEKRGIPYVLWGASVGPFDANPRAVAFFSRHLKAISLITAREAATIDYLRTLGIVDNVVPCADPAYAVAPEIMAIQSPQSISPTIGVNLSPLSAVFENRSRHEAIASQASALEQLIRVCHARILLIPHVVCDFKENDDDLRYLESLSQAVSPEYRDRVTVLKDDLGFVNTKRRLLDCHLVIAARMHCAINAIAAHVPTLLVAYSRKAVGMGNYVYRHGDWVIPLSEFADGAPLLSKVNAMLKRNTEIRDYLSRRVPDIQRDARRPLETLKRILGQNGARVPTARAEATTEQG